MLSPINQWNDIGLGLSDQELCTMTTKEINKFVSLMILLSCSLHDFTHFKFRQFLFLNFQTKMNGSLIEKVQIQSLDHNNPESLEFEIGEIMW